MVTFAWSPQQEAVFDFGRNSTLSAIIEAVAGSGKTTVLVELCKVLLEGRRSVNGRIPFSIAFVAFNKPIALEIGSKLQAAGLGQIVRSGTFHSFGLSAIRRAFGNVEVDSKGKKVQAILTAEEIDEEFQPFVRALMSFGKQAALGVLTRTDDLQPWRDLVDHHDLQEKLEQDDEAEDGITLDMLVELGIHMTIRCLKRSKSMDRQIVDFDDMLYVPLSHNLTMWQNDVVLGDEMQDTNAARRALARKMLRPGGRLIAVGDGRQAINGFTGADSDALDLIAADFNATRLPLTVTYRCPRAVVAVARQWVDHIEAAETAVEGIYRTMTEEMFLTHMVQGLTSEHAVICRNTKPLVELAFQLLRRRIPCHVEGRSIGEGILALAKKWKSATTAGALRLRLQDHLKTETERLMARGEEQKADSLTDRVETLLVLMEDVPDDEGLQVVQQRVRELFEDTDPGKPSRGVTLCTGHKSKGREWKVVYWLGRNRYQPSPFARQAWQALQEQNLMYVIATRAMEELVEITVPFRPRRGR